MRIAYLVNQYPKVSHSFIRREISALERMGFEITRISLRGWRDELFDTDDISERERTHYVLRAGALKLLFATLRLFVTRPRRFMRTLAASWRLGRRADRPIPVHLIYLAEACYIELWLRHARIEHLHAHFGTNSAEVAMFVHMLGGPHWSLTVHGPEEFDKAQFIGLAEKLRRCVFVIAISSFGRSQLFRSVEHEHWPKVHVVRCGLEQDFYSGEHHHAALSRRLICVGRLCEQKGQLLLIDAAKLLHERGVDFELVLAGDGDMRSTIEQSIKRHNLASKVCITGWISSAQVRAEIVAARALVLPSFAEGLPVVIMEAMALNRPVISTFVAGIPELVHSGQHGWLVPAGDVEALADAMQECLDAPVSQIEQMGKAAHAQVLNYHNVEVETAKLAHVFKTAVDAQLPHQP
jgi:glycosyltransferase involved in cell wall biosynthesis